MTGFFAAVRFLTALPLPTKLDPEPRRGLAWFPLVGLLLGLILAAADEALRIVPASARNGLLVTLLALSTGALHIDGVADTCDGFQAITPRLRRTAMKDAHIGAFGATGIALVLLLKYGALGGLPAGDRLVTLMLFPTVARWSVVVVAAVCRPTSSGLGQSVMGGVRPRELIQATALAEVAAVVLYGWAGLCLTLSAGAVALLLGNWLRSRLESLSGDCFGFIIEMVEVFVLFAAVIMSSVGSNG